MEKRCLLKEKQLGLFPDWEKVFSRSSPLYLEIGIGNGEFILWAAQKNPEGNFVGVEICKKVLRKAVSRISRSGVNNVRLIWMEGTKALSKLFRENSLSGIYLNFPDPWAKKKQKKRRFVNRSSVWLIANRLKKEGFFLMATDYEEYALQVAELFSLLPGMSPLWDAPIKNNLPNYYLTKYARKWLAKGLPLFYVGFKKVSEIKIPPQIEALYPLLKLEKEEATLPESILKTEKKLSFKEIEASIPKGVLLKKKELVINLLDIYYKKEGALFEFIVSEGELTQRFFARLSPHPEGYILKIHEATPVDPTDGVHKALALLTRLVQKLLSADLKLTSCKEKVLKELEKVDLSEIIEKAKIHA